MRIPRDLDGTELIRRLGRLGYEQTRQWVGTLNAILNDVAAHLEIGKDELLRRLQ